MKTEEIVNRIQKQNIKVYKACVRADVINQGIEFIHFDDFVEFAHEMGVCSVFLHEMFESIEDYYISEELIDKYGDYAIPIINKEIKEYNKSLLGIDFDMPTVIIVACSINGSVFYTIFENDILLCGEPLQSADEKVREIIDDNYDKILDKKAEQQAEILRQKEKLKQVVLADEAFSRCTNKHLRYSYLYNLYYHKLDDEFPELKRYWKSAGLGHFTKDAEDFIELS